MFNSEASGVTLLDTHFKFGENWGKFLAHVNEERLAAAVADIASFIGRDSLQGLSFLDIGCGSGLSSLAAYRMGAASITSVDIDPLNVQNVAALRTKFGVSASAAWTAYTASIVGAEAAALPKADVVYSWGVLHHTGAMWQAIDNCAALVKPRGLLYLMLYRDAWCAPLWRAIKRSYTRGAPTWQWVVRNGFAGVLIAGLLAKGRNPRRVMREYPKTTRGMSWYVDVVDWVGGYPFEYTSAEGLIAYLEPKGLRLEKISPPICRKPIGWRGTGEYRYVFRRV